MKSAVLMLLGAVAAQGEDCTWWYYGTGEEEAYQLFGSEAFPCVLSIDEDLAYTDPYADEFHSTYEVYNDMELVCFYNQDDDYE